jgi:6-phosphogluconolactonase
MTRNVLAVFKDDAEVAVEAIDIAFDFLRQAIVERGRACVALAGGSTPERMHKLMASQAYKDSIDWPAVRFFMGDERFVPADDPRSNFGMIRRTIFETGANVSPDNLFPIATDTKTANDAALAYEETLHRELPGGRFDVIFLGLGEDGHTASLFPGFPSLDEADRWVVASPPGRLPPSVERVTLTYPVLNAARNVMFLTAGEKKKTALALARDPATDFHQIPAAGVQPTDGRLLWLVDRAAAGE